MSVASSTGKQILADIPSLVPALILGPGRQFLEYSTMKFKPRAEFNELKTKF